MLRYYNKALADMLAPVGDAAIGTSIFDHVATEDLEPALAALVELATGEAEMNAVGLPMVPGAPCRRLDDPGRIGAQNYLDDPDSDVVRIRVRIRRDDRLYTA